VDLLNGMDQVPETDVITANDILEHFNEQDSYRIFFRLWNKAKELLLIHVPFEDTPKSVFGHYTRFSSEILTQWANTLDACENITPHHLRAGGCLFLKKAQVSVEL